jgi:predicted metal-dependent peptidase
LPNEPKPEEGDGGRTPEEMNAVRREVAEAIRIEASKSQGSVPEGLRRWADSVLAPAKVRWQDKLRRMTRSCVAYRSGSADFTRSKVSRRQQGLGSARGVPMLAALHAPIPRVAVVVDTSGSMGDKELGVALRETRGVLQALGVPVQLCACDAQVHGLGKVKTWRDAAALLKGGGGTSFRPAFAALMAQRQRPELIIFITDGMGDAPEIAPPANVIWLLVGSYRTRPCTWGTFIEVEE